MPRGIYVKKKKSQPSDKRTLREDALSRLARSISTATILDFAPAGIYIQFYNKTKNFRVRVGRGSQTFSSTFSKNLKDAVKRAEVEFQQRLQHKASAQSSKDVEDYTL